MSSSKRNFLGRLYAGLEYAASLFRGVGTAAAPPFVHVAAVGPARLQSAAVGSPRVRGLAVGSPRSWSLEVGDPR